jgi:hypothetical protein
VNQGVRRCAELGQALLSGTTLPHGRTSAFSPANGRLAFSWRLTPEMSRYPHRRTEAQPPPKTTPAISYSGPLTQTAQGVATLEGGGLEGGGLEGRRLARSRLPGSVMEGSVANCLRGLPIVDPRVQSRRGRKSVSRSLSPPLSPLLSSHALVKFSDAPLCCCCW